MQQTSLWIIEPVIAATFEQKSMTKSQVREVIRKTKATQY
jgi:hypothetical protein